MSRIEYAAGAALNALRRVPRWIGLPVLAVLTVLAIWWLA